jgi:multiple sugar transport system permease protein
MNTNVFPPSASKTTNVYLEQVSLFVGKHGSTLLIYLLLIALSIPFLFPFWWMFTSAFKPANDIFAYPLTLLPQTWRVENFIEVFTFQPFALHYFNSLYIAILVTLGTLIVASLSGYAFARIRFPGSSALFLLLLSALMMPTEVTIIPNYTLMQTLRLTDTHIPLILLPVLGANSIVASFLMRQYFLGIPQDLEEAGFLDGLSRWGVFWRVALPIARPALIAVTILTFLYSWNSFLEPLVFINNNDLYTLPLSLRSITDEYGQSLWNIQLAATVLTVLPVLVIYAFAQRYVVESFALSGTKG